MQQIRLLRPLALAMALVAGGAGAAHAQTEIVQPTNPDADRLAEQMRVLAASPRDVRALLDAGELSARMGDTSAAFAFFARAEAVDPTNPGIQAGRASALVEMERPGEALKLFQAAEARGLSMRPYAADRAFAYDLVGQPALAQAEYRTALQAATREDDTVRRYALSLGITGKVDEAMKQLDPLLRRSDRAAWRARAFILAMNGDVEGAQRIAGSMMPGNMGQSLGPFFRRLGGLGPADRAFAVHFGELSPTPARIADARLAPTFPAYAPDRAPVQVAAVTPPPAAPVETRARRGRRDVRPATPVPTPTPTPTPTPAPVQVAAAPLPGPPQFTRAPVEVVQPIAAPRAEQMDAPVQLAARETTPPERRAVTPAASSFVPVVGSTTLPGAARPDWPSLVDRQIPAPAVAPTTAPSQPAPVPVQPVPEPVAAAPRPEPAPPGPAAPGKEDSILASIVGNIVIPAEELAAVSAPVAEAAAPVRAAPKPEPKKPEAKPAETKKSDPKLAAKSAEAKKLDPKLAAKKPEPKKPDPAKTDPARVWVQVSGGANEGDLPKAWRTVAAKAPAAFKGKSGWFTPLRATNRVLAGPFKTAGEAQTFVNAVGKSGVSAFVFTSEAGQKVTKLGN